MPISEATCPWSTAQILVVLSLALRGLAHLAHHKGGRHSCRACNMMFMIVPLSEYKPAGTGVASGTLGTGLKSGKATMHLDHALRQVACHDGHREMVLSVNENNADVDGSAV